MEPAREGMTPEGALVALDLDGVILDTAPANIAAYQHGFRLRGLPVPGEEAIRGRIGLPALEMLEALGCPRAQAVGLYEQAIKPFYLHRAPGLVRLFEGVDDCLRALRAHGACIAACSSGAEEIQRPLLEHLGVLTLFDSLHTPSRSRYHKPDPAFLGELIRQLGGRFSRVYLVDDTEEGLAMGLPHGAILIHAAYGYGRLRTLRPHHVIRAPGELPGLVCGGSG